MKNQKVLLFDYDDTLVVTYKIRRHALIEAGKRFYNQVITMDQVDAAYGKPWLELLTMVFGEPESPLKMSERFLTILPEYPKEYQPGFHELIKYLQKDGIISGIITASGSKILEADMISMKFPRENFHYIQTADDSEFHKPDGRVFDPALRFLKNHYGMQRDAIIYVGDSLSDKIAAQAAGIEFVGVTTGKTPIHELEKGNKLVLSSLLELRSLM